MVAARLFAGSAAFLALVQVLCVALALSGVGMTRPIAIAGGGLALLVSVAFASRFGSQDAPDETPPPETRAVRIANGMLSLAGMAVVLWGVATWVILWRLAWLRDPLGWDVLWYHVPAINEWVVRGSVGFYPPYFPGAERPLEAQFASWLNLPMGVELTAFWLYFVAGTDRLVDGANLLYWPLAVTALAVLARGLGARGVWPWTAAVLLAGASLFVAQSATGYVDVGFGAAAMAAIAAASLFVFDAGRRRWWSAVLLGACTGLMIGAKGFGAPFAIVVLGAAWLGAWARSGWASWRSALGGVTLAGLLVMAVGGYWYVRNAVHTGNPIYPIQVQLGEKILIPGYDVSNYDERDWIVRPALKPYPAWARMYVAWTQPDVPSLHPGETQHYAPSGGLGFVWLLGGLPAALFLAIVAARRRTSVIARRYAFLAATVLLMLSVTTIKWQARYTFWLHALGLPAIAWVASEAATRWPRRRGHLVTLAAVAGLVGVAVWESRQALRLEWKTGRLGNTASGVPTFRPAVDSLWPGLRESPGFRDVFAARAIARGPWESVPGTRASGVLALPLGRRIVVLPPEPAPARLRQLAADGIEWVFWEARDDATLPYALAAGAVETFRYRRSGDYDFYAIRIAGSRPPVEELP